MVSLRRLAELIERIQAQPPEVRAELEPLMEDVLEQVRFRSRILTVARDGLERLRFDLETREVRPRRHPSRA